ncbi:archease [Bdellovibrio sp.]|uniref:archease n=1 Tax=Bdellovibrio sp. TaxID=28201 RepID=UPI0039E3AE71
MAHWEHFPHGSDIGIRGVGNSLSESFTMVAKALTALMVDPDKISSRQNIKEEISSDTLDLLLYDWINQLIYEAATKKMIFCQFDLRVTQDPPHLSAVLAGETVDHTKHDPGVEVKGATFTELKVEQSDHTWVCQCIVDV